MASTLVQLVVGHNTSYCDIPGRRHRDLGRFHREEAQQKVPLFRDMSRPSPLANGSLHWAPVPESKRNDCLQRPLSPCYTFETGTECPETGTVKQVFMISELKHRLARLIPPNKLGVLDYYRFPNLQDMWGGPFNGQCFRQLMFIDLCNACQFEAIVETGAFRGSTTLYLANNVRVPVYSSEVNPRYLAYAARRLRMCPNAKLFCEDSRRFLKGLELARDVRTFFYLDAHWHDDLPLSEETAFIVQSFSQFVVMIDDFEVPNDPGYAFDDYGNGKKLSLSDFRFDLDERVSIYFPNRSSGLESGARRGSIVLVSRSLAPEVSKLGSLQPLGSIPRATPTSLTMPAVSSTSEGTNPCTL